MDKKGQGLSMTTIVIAALALLVLVVLTLIFTFRMGLWSEGMEDTTSCKTYCESINKVEGKAADQPSCGTGTFIKSIKVDATNYCCCT